MLVLTRRVGEELIIGDDVRLRILSINWSDGVQNVRIGIDAPASTKVLRAELAKNGSDGFVFQFDAAQPEFAGDIDRPRPRPVVRYLRRRKNEGNY